MFNVGLKIFEQDRWLENNAGWKPYLISAGFRSLGALGHLDLSLI